MNASDEKLCLLLDFLNECLKVDPRTRKSARELLMHDWLKINIENIDYEDVDEEDDYEEKNCLKNFIKRFDVTYFKNNTTLQDNYDNTTSSNFNGQNCFTNLYNEETNDFLNDFYFPRESCFVPTPYFKSNNSFFIHNTNSYVNSPSVISSPHSYSPYTTRFFETPYLSENINCSVTSQSSCYKSLPSDSQSYFFNTSNGFHDGSEVANRFNNNNNSYLSSSLSSMDSIPFSYESNPTSTYSRNALYSVYPYFSCNSSNSSDCNYCNEYPLLFSVPKYQLPRILIREIDLSSLNSEYWIEKFSFFLFFLF
jgi:hypothetical protein